MVEHISEALRFSSGNINSACFSMIGRVGTLEKVIDEPEKYKPITINTRLSGSKVLGPTKKFDIPLQNNPRVTIVVSSIHLVKWDTKQLMITYPKTTLPNTNPWTYTKSVNSCTLNDNNGSK